MTFRPRHIKPRMIDAMLQDVVFVLLRREQQFFYITSVISGRISAEFRSRPAK